MASWSELLEAFNIETSRTPDPNWFDKKLKEHLDAISKRLGNATVIFYASAFLQKADDDNVSITREDINGFMNALAGTPTDNGLVLILHTPGGDPNAVESIVEYLHAKFDRINVVIPYLAMSGGAMISLAEQERSEKANTIAAYFNAEDTPSHGQVHVHGQRIGAEKLRELGLKLEFLEDNQGLQNDVLTSYHLMTLIFEMTPSLKFIASDRGKMWVKQQQQILIPASPPVPQQLPSNNP